jgi:hypothetical protein
MCDETENYIREIDSLVAKTHQMQMDNIINLYNEIIENANRLVETGQCADGFKSPYWIEIHSCSAFSQV